jgi:prolyl oligopeptidase
MSIDARPTLAAPDDDPYLWLEDIEGQRALTWVDDQNKRTLAKFGDARFAADRDTLAAIYDRPDNIPIVGRRATKLYNFWKDKTNPRGLWRSTTLESFRHAQPQWEVILDLDALASQENEDWIWGGASTLPDQHRRAILRLSRGGSDAVVLREFDIAQRTFVSDGFDLAEAKSSAQWLDTDTLLVASPLGEGMSTRSGYARTARLWRRGTDFVDAPVVFETAVENMGLGASLDRTQESETVWFTERLGFFDQTISIGDRNGPRARLDLPTDIELDCCGDWLILQRRTAWECGGINHPPDTLLATSLAAFLRGERKFSVLFEPGERRALQQFFWCHGRLILSILDELRPLFEILEPPGMANSAEASSAESSWARSRLPGLPEIGVVNVWRFDNEEIESNGDLLAVVESPLTPSSFMLLEATEGPGLLKSPVVLKQAPRTFTADGLVVTRHEAISIDGERIPYTQVGPAEETGDAPVHMTGYGGFNLPTLPRYNSAVGKLWLERGGTSVTTNIRGGGEFGTRWHEAGRHAGKKLTHDDFAAVAADLVRRGVTRPGRIAAEGGSNGGILITNMLVRYPERFGALFCTVPLIDMRRYSKLLAGASWIAEYGDPDKPEDWSYLQTYSAYHLAEPGRPYPPILIATTRRDDRVHPGHARKMTAKLHAIGYEVFYYEPAAGGHGYGKDNKERAAFTALGYAFLRDKIGWKDEHVV